MKEPLTKHKMGVGRLMQFNIAHHILYTCSAAQIQQQYPTSVPET